MFLENDRALLTARRIFVALTIVFALLSLTMGIVLAALIHWALIFTAVVGWFLDWLMWVFTNLLLSYLCDVKLIRNKLYEESNDDLAAFWKSDAEVGLDELEPDELDPDEPEITDNDLKKLDQLLYSGAITSEQYEQIKAKAKKSNHANRK